MKIQRFKKIIRKGEPYIFLLPFFITFSVFFLWPIIYTFAMSFTDWAGVHRGNFVGLENYISILNSSTFRKALYNTFWYAIVGGTGLVILSFSLAYILTLKYVRGKKIFRTIFFLPVAVPIILIGVVFALMFDWHYGIINYVLRLLSINPIHWLGQPVNAKPSVVIMFIWRMLGICMIYFIAGLQGLNEQVFEAAKIDGASSFQILTKITIPMLKPIILFVSVVVTIEVFQIFQEPYILFSFTAMGASGGPRDAALSLLQYMHRLGFRYQHMGQASIVALVIFLLILSISLLQLKLFGFFKEN